MGVEEKRELAPEEAMEKEEWGRAEVWGTGWALAFLVSLVREPLSFVFPYWWLEARL